MSLYIYYLIGMTDMSYNIKCTFAEIFIFKRVIVQKYIFGLHCKSSCGRAIRALSLAGIFSILLRVRIACFFSTLLSLRSQ